MAESYLEKEGRVSRMEFLRAFIAMFLFACLMTILVVKCGVVSPSNDVQFLSLAIVAAGALAHSEK